MANLPVPERGQEANLQPEEREPGHPAGCPALPEEDEQPSGGSNLLRHRDRDVQALRREAQEEVRGHVQRQAEPDGRVSRDTFDGSPTSLEMAAVL